MRKAVISVVFALAAVVGGVAMLIPASSAHTPRVFSTCDTLTVALRAYDASGVNRVSVVINGETLEDTEFGRSFRVGYELDPDVTSAYVVTVTAHDDPDGTRGWAGTFEGEQEPCTVPTTPATTTPASTTSESTPTHSTTTEATTSHATTSESTTTQSTTVESTTPVTSATTPASETSTTPTTQSTTTAPSTAVSSASTTPTVVTSTSTSTSSSVAPGTTTQPSSIVLSTGPTGSLPLTGSNATVALTGVAGLLLVAGIAMTLATRNRGATHQD